MVSKSNDYNMCIVKNSAYCRGVSVMNNDTSICCLQVQHLIAELNEILAREVVDEGGLWKKKLQIQSLQLFEFLPQAIQEQLMLERDPHGNVQV